MQHKAEHAAEEKSAEDKSLVLWQCWFFHWKPVVRLILFKATSSGNSWVAMMTDQLAWLISFRRALENKAVAGWTTLWVFFALLIEN